MHTTITLTLMQIIIQHNPVPLSIDNLLSESLIMCFDLLDNIIEKTTCDILKQYEICAMCCDCNYNFITFVERCQGETALRRTEMPLRAVRACGAEN